MSILNIDTTKPLNMSMVWGYRGAVADELHASGTITIKDNGTGKSVEIGYDQEKTFTISYSGQVFTQTLEDYKHQEEGVRDVADMLVNMAILLILIPSHYPLYESTLMDGHISFKRLGNDYAKLWLKKDKTTSLMSYGWTGEINNTPWNTLLYYWSHISDAFEKRLKIHAPFFVIKDKQTGLYYTGLNDKDEPLYYVKQTKAKKFKRGSDASVLASRLRGTQNIDAPVAPQWSKAYQQSYFPPCSTTNPLASTCEILEVDKTTKSETVYKSAEDLESQITYRLKVQDKITRPYGYGASLAFDAAMESSNQSHDTLVLVFDENGAFDMKAHLKSKGLSPKSYLLRKTEIVRWQAKGVMWSMATNQASADLAVSDLDETLAKATLSFAEILA